MHNYLVRVLVRFSVVGPTVSIGRHFWGGHPYIGSTTVLPEMVVMVKLDTMHSLVSEQRTYLIGTYMTHLHVNMLTLCSRKQTNTHTHTHAHTLTHTQ